MVQKYRVGKIIYSFLDIFYSKKHISWAFCVDWEFEGEINFGVGIFLSKNLLGSGYRKDLFSGLTCWNMRKIFTANLTLV